MLDKENFITILDKLFEQSKKYYDDFNSADAKIGDGDLGITILHGLDEIHKNITLFNGCFYPCPNLENYVSAISNQFQNKNKFFTVPKIIIKIIIILSSVVTKNLSPLSNYHYKRLNKYCHYPRLH